MTARFIIHPGTGTILDADECKYVELDPQKESLDDENVLSKHGYPIESPFINISFSAEAVAEHYREHQDKSFLVDGFTPEDYAAAGEWAYDSPLMWDRFYDALDYGVDMVRREKDGANDAGRGGITLDSP